MYIFIQPMLDKSYSQIYQGCKVTPDIDGFTDEPLVQYDARVQMINRYSLQINFDVKLNIMYSFWD